MSSPLVRVDGNGRILPKNSRSIEDIYGGYAPILAGGVAIAAEPDTTIPGSIGTETEDIIEIDLVAGQTYTFSYRGTVEGGIEDPYLALFGPGFAYITEDDDGGLGRSSQITHTAATSGTYYLYATSWYHIDPGAPGYPDYRDSGDYTIAIWSPGEDAGDTIATAGSLDLGANYAYLDTAGDVDLYAIDLTAGSVYTFVYNGGVSGGADWDDEPGESLGVLALYDADGNELVPLSVNYETGITFVAEESGTYYLSAQAYSDFIGDPPMTGGYTIDVATARLEDLDPLESLYWDSAENVPFVDTNGDGTGDTAYVYFAPAGENFGELADDGVTPMTTYGWTQAQIDSVMGALTHYEYILGVDYVITTNADEATFRLLTTVSTEYGAYFYPQDEASYGDAMGIGAFNLNSGGFGTRPESLVQGGYSYSVILHEFGHAHGLAHPHDTGGGSEVLLGVTASTGSYGVFNLNQGVYTVMSYNDAWDFHPDGPTTEAPNGSIGQVISHGWSGSLSAFDIAALQNRYGVVERALGNDTYTLDDNYQTAFYQTIWDSGGTDTIAYGGALDAQIDLTAATLDYSPTGGGVLSFLYNEPQPDYTTEVKGGFTIAGGVVIENATGGSGDDVLIGNAAANVLTGNDGADTLIGRAGSDTLIGGGGADVLQGGEGNDLYVVSETIDTIEELEGEGVDTVRSSVNFALGAWVENLELTGNARNGTGNALDNTIYSSAIANRIDGGAGNDTVSYEYSTGGVLVRLDEPSSSGGWFGGLVDWLEDLLPDGVGGYATGDDLINIENITGSTRDDQLLGNRLDNVLIGLGGDDILYGNAGNDVLKGDGGRDFLFGGDGNDSLDGGAGNDVLDGGNGNDALKGGAGDDAIQGGKGNDLIDGGAGNDTLAGGQGNDIFNFADLGGRDVIADFERGKDKIDLGDIDANSLVAGDQGFTWIGSSAFSGAAGQVRGYSERGDFFLAGDVDGDRIADFLIEVDRASLQPTDIIFA